MEVVLVHPEPLLEATAEVVDGADDQAGPQPDPQPVAGEEAAAAATNPPVGTAEQTGEIPVDLETLDTSFLNIMGKRVVEDRALGPPIYKDIAVRWEDILKKGLPEEEKVMLVKKHPPPSNCVVIDPPKLNEEVKAVLDDAKIKRDARLIGKQQKITTCLAILGQCSADVIRGNLETLSLLERLSEAGRLLADLQRDESLTRKSLVIANISSAFKDTLESAHVDEWLFGNDLADRLKTAKTLERSTQELKAKMKGSEKGSKNFGRPSRRQQSKGPAMAGSKLAYKRQSFKKQPYKKHSFQKSGGPPNGNRNNAEESNQPFQKKKF